MAITEFFIKNRFTVNSKWIDGDSFQMVFNLKVGVTVAASYTLKLFSALNRQELETYTLTPVDGVLTWSPVQTDLDGETSVFYELKPTSLTAANAILIKGVVNVIATADAQDVDCVLEVSSSTMAAQEFVKSQSGNQFAQPVSIKPVIPDAPGGETLTFAEGAAIRLYSDNGTLWELRPDNTGAPTFTDVSSEGGGLE